MHAARLAAWRSLSSRRSSRSWRSRARQIPDEEGWAYEPKYDGFRALAFVDGDELFLQSRSGPAAGALLPRARLPGGPLRDRRRAADPRRRRPRGLRRAAEPPPPGRVAGEDAGRADAGAVSRLRPARGRRRVALESPFTERRAALEQLVGGFEDPGSVELTPLVATPPRPSPGCETGEGVIAKRVDSPYLRGERKAMVKVKRLRTIDAVVAGWRPGKEESTVGSLMLGLYDGDGELHVVGHTSGLKAKEKRELVETLAPYETGERGSADPSRWSADRDLEWVALRPELVIEVSFDHVSAGRIRHGAKILRWREDKPARVHGSTSWTPELGLESNLADRGARPASVRGARPTAPAGAVARASALALLRRGSAGPASARPSAWGSAAARARRPGPRSSSRSASSSSESSEWWTSSIVADGSPRSASRAGTVSRRSSRRVDVGDLVPLERASRRGRRASGAPTRPRRRCGRGRSGCSRRRRRGAPPSTTSTSPAPSAARPRAPAPAPRGAPR